MRRVLVVTWAVGTATGVLLGLFGVQLVSSRFSAAGVSPLSRPEVVRALEAARSHPGPGDEVALPASSTPDTAVPPTSAAVDAAAAPPSAETTSNPAPAPPASTLPRPGATAGDLVEAAAAPSTTSTAPPDTSTTTSTAAPADNGKAKGKSDSKGKGSDQKGGSSSTSTTAPKKATSTTVAQPSKPAPSPQTAADTRSINSVGGVVAVVYSDGKVQLKWARPQDGYQVWVGDNGPDRVIVYFMSGNHTSTVVAYYNSNKPDSAVYESGSNKSGHH